MTSGDEIRGADGFRLLLLRTSAETDGELLEMEATYGGSAPMPPEHFHPTQSERFEVLEGQVRAIVDGEERRYTVGDVFDVPAGVPHTMGAEGPARTRWEVRPALRTAEFFERLHGGDTGPNIGEFLAEYADEIQFTGK